MYKTLIIILAILTRLPCISMQSCEYIVSLGINYYDVVDSTNGDFKMVTECISDVSINASYRAAKVWIVEASVPILEKYFISNMEALEEIVIENCFVDSIEPGAFFNVPLLKTIKIYKNPIKTITRGVFDVIPTLEKISIFENKISNVEDDTFANLPLLREFEFNGNQLDHMKREWFTNTSNIETFIIKHNLITTVPKGMFHGWRKLKYIYLGSNRISVIESPMFKNNSPVIIDVDFKHNKLTSLSSDVFPDSFFFIHLVISGNLFNYLSDDFLNKIRVSNFYIYGNPFSCPCLKKIEKILGAKRVTIDRAENDGVKACKDDSLPVCGNSLNSSDTCIESVDKELTKRVNSYWKKSHYDTVIDKNGHQCAIFEDFD